MPRPASAPATFDARPLTAPVAPADARAFAAQVRAQRGGVSAGTIIGMIIIGIVCVVAGSMLLTLLFAGIIALASGSSPALTIIAVLVVIAAAGGIGAAIWFWLRAGRVRQYRLHRFAAANGMAYVNRITDPPLPGMIFSLGRGRVANDLVRGTAPRFVEFGNYEYTTGSGKSQSTHRWGYVAVKLDVPLPNIVLDAVGNNSIFGTNLPTAFQKSQRLSLEGNFDQHFQLYCPDGYEADALYLFTPDIMARFIDNAAQLDVEIVDDWMFLYMPRAASTLDPATWSWLFGAIGALMTKFDQWARWRDDRLRAAQAAAIASPPALPHRNAPGGPVSLPKGPSPALPFAAPVGMLRPPPGVAPQGRRLKKRFSWATGIVIVFITIVAILPRVIDLFTH